MITVTKKAAQHIKQELNKRGYGEGIRVGTKKSGCSGMAYTLEFADEIAASDKIFKTDGISIFVDPKDYVYLKGAELDFVKEGLNEGLKVNNPNESTKCGCGESFNV